MFSMKYKIQCVIDAFLHRFFKLYSEQEMLNMIEEVSQDFACERHLRDCVSDSYLNVYLSIHAELSKAALLDNEACDDDDLCTECREL